MPIDGINEIFSVTFVALHSKLPLWLLIENMFRGFFTAAWQEVLKSQFIAFTHKMLIM